MIDGDTKFKVNLQDSNNLKWNENKLWNANPFKTDYQSEQPFRKIKESPKRGL